MQVQVVFALNSEEFPIYGGILFIRQGVVKSSNLIGNVFMENKYNSLFMRSVVGKKWNRLLA